MQIYAIGAATTDVCIFISYRNHTLEFRDASAKQHSNGRNEASSPLAAINLTSGGQSAMHTSASPPKSSDDKSASTIGTLVILNGIAYGLLLSAVAVNFPSGIIVALIYFPLYLMCVARLVMLPVILLLSPLTVLHLIIRHVQVSKFSRRLGNAKESELDHDCGFSPSSICISLGLSIWCFCCPCLDCSHPKR